MKNIFIERYEDAIERYFSCNGDYYTRSARIEVVSEYERILKEVFKMTDKEVKEIYNKMYADHYFKGA